MSNENYDNYNPFHTKKGNDGDQENLENQENQNEENNLDNQDETDYDEDLDNNNLFEDLDKNIDLDEDAEDPGFVEGEISEGEDEDEYEGEDEENQEESRQSKGKIMGLLSMFKSKPKSKPKQKNNDDTERPSNADEQKMIFGMPQKTFKLLVILGGVGVLGVFGYEMIIPSNSGQNNQAQYDNFDDQAERDTNSGNSADNNAPSKKTDGKAVADDLGNSTDKNESLEGSTDKNEADKNSLKSDQQAVEAESLDNMDGKLSEILDHLAELKEANENLTSNLSEISVDDENEQSSKKEAQKIEDLESEKEKLSEEIDTLLSENEELQAKVEEYKGKNDWLRVLENRHKRRVNELEAQLEKKTSINQVFSNYKILGMTEGVCVVAQKNDLSKTETLEEGDVFNGITITSVDVKKSALVTDKGTITKKEING